MQKIKRMKHGGNIPDETKTELDKYVSEDVEDDAQGFDVLLWWKINSPQFLILSALLCGHDWLRAAVNGFCWECVGLQT